MLEPGTAPPPALRVRLQYTAPAIIKALLAAGAEVEARDEGGDTPLPYAALLSDGPAVITTLLDAGADAAAEDAEGLTPWDYATKLSRV